MILWIILTVMIALAAVGLTIPLVRRYEQRPQAKTVDILKGQLGEVDAQVAASLIEPAEAEALRSEIKRRILVEDRDAGTAARPFPQTAMPWVALGLVAIVTLCATALYAMMGHPELTSSAAVSASSAAPEAQTTAADASNSKEGHPNGQVASMIASLETKLQQNPGDAQGWQMLAWSYMRTGRPADAAKAYAKAVAIEPTNVEYLSAQGEAMVQSEGKVSDEAAAIFQRALKGDPADPRARYFLAIHRDQTGDHKGAMDDFIALLKSAPPDAPWASQVRTYVEDLAKEQHVDLTGKLPPAPAAPGPNSTQLAAAGNMSDADRQAMIHSMVDKLAGELKANPKDTGGWVRLMRARMVLGESQQAAQDYKQAHQAFAGDAAAQAALQEAAKSLGVPGA
ncbi:MAG: c-type cytochrome biogenesis protein CcmI [Alphaproteobacteria bacterium]|jgi:cytochrome c-type biogenesis protein CcmH